jgi:anti-anti-sigma factor
MDLIGSSSFIIPDRSPMSGEGADGDIVIWLRGEHDISTDDALSLTLARAVALDDSGLVLDLSDVEFMSASTLGVIVRTREFLRARSRSLTVRAPSPCARRIIEVCGLGDLLASGPEEPLAGSTLASWVEVPASERSGGPAHSADAPTRAPARSGPAPAVICLSVSPERSAVDFTARAAASQGP